MDIRSSAKSQSWTRSRHGSSPPPLSGRDREGGGSKFGLCELTPLPTPPPQGGREHGRASGRRATTSHQADARSTPAHLAGARAADRTHASAARALRRHGLADPRRQRSTGPRQVSAACATNRRPASPRTACTCTPARSWCRSTRTARRSRCRAGAAAHARDAAGLRLAGTRVFQAGWIDDNDRANSPAGTSIQRAP